ncbi:MAG: SprT family zinc-dependent metalloprotease [Raoultibacter sp.]
MRGFLPRYRPQAKPHPQAAPPCEFTVEGIVVRLVRKQVKNVNLRVKEDGSVAVSAPVWVSTAQVQDFVRGRLPWIRECQRRQAASPRTLKQQASAEQLHAWRQQVQGAVPPLIACWEPIMGVASQTVVYRNMSSRWGSCNPRTGRICINIQLAAYPPQCLEYVVVHELCHLLEGGHGPRFKALMTRFLPDWKQRRALLKQAATISE